MLSPLMLWPLVLGLLGSAHAVPGTGQIGNSLPKAPPTIVELVQDLSGNDAPKQLLAARDLQHQTRIADRMTGAGGDSLWALEARAELAELTRHALPACLDKLQMRRVGPPCADLAGRLEEPVACAPLAAAVATSPNWANRHAAARALRRLGAVCLATP
jgi:hypothetical protein